MPQNSLATLGYAAKNSIASGGLANQVMANPPPTGSMITRTISNSMSLLSTFSASSATRRSLTDDVNLSSSLITSTGIKRNLTDAMNLSSSSLAASGTIRNLTDELNLSGVITSHKATILRMTASLDFSGIITKVQRDIHIIIPEIALSISDSVTKTQLVVRQIASTALTVLASFSRRTITTTASSIFRHDSAKFSNQNSSKSNFSNQNSSKSKFSNQNSTKTKYFSKLKL